MRLIIRSIKKRYDEATVLDKAGYTFESGTVYGLTGCKGAGKTTLLNCICGECVPDNGYVRLDVGGGFFKADYMDFGIVYDEPLLPENLTGGQYIKYLIDMHKPAGDSIAEYFENMSMDSELINGYIGDYSDDEKQRLQLVGIMITSPAVILMDEPKLKGKMYDVVRKFVDEMKKSHIIIIASEDEKRLKTIADEKILIEGGILSGNKVWED